MTKHKSKALSAASKSLKSKNKTKPHREIGGDSAFGIVETLPYLKPYDFLGLLATYRSHQIANLEFFTETTMERVFVIGKHNGRVRISDEPKKARLRVEIDFPDVTKVAQILEQTRHMFDLDFEHDQITNSLSTYKRIHKIHLKYPGLRISSGWDPFEIAITTILGQLVSVERAKALSNDLVELLGESSGFSRDGVPIKLFPTPVRLAKADLTLLKTTRIRKKTLNEFARAVIEKRISFDRNQSLEEFQKRMLAIYGVGPWTASYVALKALKHSDAFPGTDLILARALDLFPAGAIDKLRPHRGMVAILLWKEYAAQLSKKVSK